MEGQCALRTKKKDIKDGKWHLFSLFNPWWEKEAKSNTVKIEGEQLHIC